MLTQLLEYVNNNPQEIMFQAVLSVAVIIIVALAATIWINQYRYRKHHGAGGKHFQSGDLDSAIRELRLARKLAKKTLSGKKRDVESTSRLLSEVAITGEKWDEAIASLTECIGIAPEKEEYHVSLVECYLQAGQYGNARESLEKALQLIRPVRLEELRKKRAHAVARDRRIEAIGRELADLTRSLAVCRSDRLDRLELLKPDFQGRKFILEGIAETEEDVIELAKFYTRQHILKKAPAEDKTIRDGFDDAEEWNLEPEEIPEEIIQPPEEKEAVMEERRDDPQTEAPLGAEEQEPSPAQEPDGAEEPVPSAAPEEPEEPEELKEESPVSYLAQAREALDSLELEPLSPEFYALSAFLSVEEGNIEAAEESFQQAISLDPQYAEAYYNLALLYVDRFDDLETAIGHFRSALESDPQFAEAHHNLALLLLGSGEDLFQVKHHMGEAIKLDPRFSEVYYNLALLLARKDYKEFLLG